MSLYTVPHSANIWYYSSLSYTLHLVAQGGKDMIPKELALALKDAGVRVFAHELYFNEMYSGVHFPEPNPMFVHMGYLRALKGLLELLQEPPNGYHAYAYREIKGHLDYILTIIQLKCQARESINLKGDGQLKEFLSDFAQVLVKP